MRLSTTINAIGRATWSGVDYVVEIGETLHEVASRDGAQHRNRLTFDLFWTPAAAPVPLEDRTADRSFSTSGERDERLAQLAPGLTVEKLTVPRLVQRARPLDELVGQILVGVWFVSEYVQLQFQPSGNDPVPAHQGPLTFDVAPFLAAEEATLRRDDPGYADTLVSMIYESLQAAVEYLDTGLDLTFGSGKRLFLPLGPLPDGEWSELALFQTKHYVAVWVPGEPPFDQSPPCVTANRE